MKKLFLYLSFLPFLAHAQVLITDGNDVSLTSEQEIVLELKAVNANKGLLLPRLQLQSITAAAPLSTHTLGILAFNTANAGTANNRVYPGLYYNDGTQWVRLNNNSTPEIGDIKYSAMTTDHDGWYLLDGRNISTLPSTAAQNATSLGFTTIPNMTSRFLKAKTTTENVGTLGGSSNITILQANFPNFTFSGTTVSSGSHTHTYNDRGNGTATGNEVNNNPRVDNSVNATRTTSTNGNHSHTFSISTGGSGQAISFTPSYLASSVFVYLGV